MTAFIDLLLFQHIQAQSIRRYHRFDAKNYGVVISQDGKVDEAATTKLREQMKKERGATQIFNFGAKIEELRARCLAETGLPAPKPPQFQFVLTMT